MTDTCVNYKINDGTKCTLDGLRQYANDYDKIDNTDYFAKYTENNFDKFKSENIKLYNTNIDTKDSIYTICDIDNNNNPYLNCAFNYKSPFFSLDNDNKCSAILTELPPNFTYDISKNVIVKPDINEYLFSENEKFCENKWYDWFTIPNYHLGNSYYADTDGNNNLKTCYTPCGPYQVPYATSNNLCIPKNIIFGGIFGNTVDFSPLALIMLIGATKQDLINHYNVKLTYDIAVAKAQNQVELMDSNIVDRYKGFNNTNLLNIINKAQIEINNAVNANIFNGFKTYAAGDPNTNTIRMNNFLNNGLLTHQSTSFVIPSMPMQNIMYNANLFDPNLYLNVCYNIANTTYNSTIDDHPTFQSDKTKFIQNYNTYKSKLNNLILEKDKNDLISSNCNIYYRICDTFNLNLFVPIEYDKIIRLANIFKKATNICFDNKSSFSSYIFTQITSPNASPILYDTKYFDSEYNTCPENQFQYYNSNSQKFECALIPPCDQGYVFNNITNNCVIINSTGDYQGSCSGNKLYTNNKSNSTNDLSDLKSPLSLPLSYSNLPNYSILVKIFLFFMLCFAIIFILILFNELFGDVIMYIIITIMNYIVMIARLIYYTVKDFTWNGTWFRAVGYDIARNNKKIAAAKLAEIDDYLSKYINE